MILKSGKERFPSIIGLVIVLLLSLVTIANVSPRYSYFALYDEIMGNDLGFSSPSSYNGNTIHFFYLMLKKTPNIVLATVQGYPGRPAIDRIDLDIKFTEYQSILADRKKAIADQILTSPSEVKGSVRFNGDQIKAKMRLKGDLAQHWRSRHQMSLRVSLKGEHTFLGFKKFSLHKPSARQHPYEQTFQSLVRQAGNLSPIHKYADIYMNGSKWGILNVEEHMSKELLEKQRRKESLIVRFGNEQDWAYRKQVKEPYGNYRLSDPLFNIHVYSEKKYLNKPIHRKWMSYIANQRLHENKSLLYDVDSYSRTFLLTAVWNNSHTLEHANSRHYFNPFTLRLEPITTDQGEFYDLKEKQRYSFGTDIYKQVISTPEYSKRLRENLAAVANVIPNTQKEIDYFQSYFPFDNKVDASIVGKNLNLIINNPEKYLIPKKEPINNNNTIKNILVLPNDIQAADFPMHIYTRHFDDGSIDLFNLLPEAVQLKQITLDGKPIDMDVVAIPGFVSGKYTPFSIKTGLKGVFDGHLKVITEYRGHLRESEIGPTHLSTDLINPLVNKTPEGLPYLKKINDNEWLIPSGQWEIEKPVTVQGKLIVEAGAHVKFAKKAYVIINGPLIAEGTLDNNIVFESKDTDWKGLYIFDATEPSILQHVIIKNTNALEKDILNLTGGVTFYRADAFLTDVLIQGSQAEDALNIVNSYFKLEKVVIEDAISDGFDSDYSDGEIVDSFFYNIQGDATDFSGSNVNITNIEADGIHDKAISVGENSKVSVIGGTLKNVGVGIASKDGSNTAGRNIKIDSFKLYAAMTYIKKDYFGMPELKLENCDIEKQNNTYLRQIGTYMIVDDAEIRSKKLNVKKLYQGDVMKK